MTIDSKTPNPIDTYVGARVRVRRKFLGMSQDNLASHLGLTFQQVQKYERGANRISASKLYEISVAMRVSISHFFEGYSDAGAPDQFDDSRAERAVHDFLATGEGIDLATAFPGIRSLKVRKKLVELVRSLSEDDA